MVLTEVLQNAVEHGFGGGAGTDHASTRDRLVGRLRVTVDDDGAGLPAGFDLDGVDQPGAVDRADPGGVRARTVSWRSGSAGARGRVAPGSTDWIDARSSSR